MVYSFSQSAVFQKQLKVIVGIAVARLIKVSSNIYHLGLYTRYACKGKQQQEYTSLLYKQETNIIYQRTRCR